MNKKDFEAAKETVRRERDIPNGMCSMLTGAQAEELVRIIREEVGLIHRQGHQHHDQQQGASPGADAAPRDRPLGRAGTLFSIHHKAHHRDARKNRNGQRDQADDPHGALVKRRPS